MDKCLVLLNALQHNKYTGRTALTADTMQHREFLLNAGADLVLLPFRDAAAQAVELLAKHSSTHPEQATKTDE